MIENVRGVIVDTSVLRSAFNEDKVGSIRALAKLQEHQIPVRVTSAIRSEYQRHFGDDLSSGTRVNCDNYEISLPGLIANFPYLSLETQTENLKKQYPQIYYSQKQRVDKWILAANLLAGETKKLGIFITNDQNITGRHNELLRADIYAICAADFIATFT